MRAVGVIAAFGLALSATGAAARDLFVDNLAGYTIESRVLDAPNCEGPAIPDGMLKTFEQGLCVFHRPARSPADSQRAANLMREAQTRGLPPVHQQLAGLISGLANCAEATRHLDAYRASGNQSRMEQTLFCRDRRHSQADLNAIEWNHALFEYADGLASNRTLDQRLAEMSVCQAGPLSADFDAQCGLISNLSDTEIDAFADGAAGKVIESYFASVESPITAMFSRKLKRAEGLVQSSRAGIDDIKAGADTVNKEYAALNQVYEAARDTKMGPIYNAYREAILRATSILDEFDRWKGGLFITSENINLMPKITERSGEIAGEKTRVDGLAFEAKASALVGDIKRIINADAENRAAVAAFCRIYFCELTNRRAMADVIRTCRRPALANNPLCVGQNGQITNGTLTVDFQGPHSITVKALCQSAGLDPLMTEVNMDPARAASCLSELR
ncbi:hypothetical protein A9174_30585 [Mesorhizobium loti NZP2037]|uniref:DUF1311 domain-containing protein n=1 Tax=Rhizobium loti TaxID=381 RepID=M5AMH3_RHILI|nr:hypothetical protein [Mesorhizobium loti]ANN60623.1 hypothetical protein A9174_30585 [Mesorhizobium loti NZP2037]BAN10049.1 conserved hypothetical protein [Mesorhizobium loti NZP2037]